MDIKTKFMIRALVGFSLGMLIGIFTFVASASDTLPVDKVYLVLHLILSGLLGVVSNGGAIVYDFEEWSIARATFTHYIISFMTLFVISEMLGWFPHSVLLIVFIVFSIVYFIIWLSEYLSFKNEVKQMNEELKSMLMINSGKGK